MRTRSLLLVLLFGGALSACTGGLEEAAEVLETPSAVVPPPATTAPSVSPSTSPSDGVEPGGKSIVVTAPERNLEILSPVVVAGGAESATGEVFVRVVDAGGLELAAMNAPVSCGSGCRGEFRVELAFFVQARQDGLVQVFEVGPAGAAEHLVEVPVTLVPGV